MWGEGSLGEFDIIIGSDIVYYGHNTNNLLKALLENTRTGSKFILAYIKRHDLEEEFFKLLKENWDLCKNTTFKEYQVQVYIRYN